MKNNHWNRNSAKFRPTWYLVLVIWPAIAALMFIVAGSGNDQQSNLSQGQPGVSATAPMVFSDATVYETTSP